MDQSISREDHRRRCSALSPETLNDAGALLFGPAWISPMAEALGVNRRTVERMRSGKNPVSPWMAHRLIDLIEQKTAPLLARIRAEIAEAEKSEEKAE